MSVENDETQLVMEEPQERSRRKRRNTAKTYVEPASSSEDIGGRQKGREVVAKNTWALNGSEESEIDSTASYTSEDGSESSDNESEASDFSQSIQGEDSEREVDAGLDDESIDEHSGQIQGFPRRKHESDHGKRGKISTAKLKYMVTHGTLNEVQRGKPWEVIAEECGVVASLEEIQRALGVAGIPIGQRTTVKLRAAPAAKRTRTFTKMSITFPTEFCKLSTPQLDACPVPILTSRDSELVAAAFQSLKDGCKLRIDYKQFLALSGVKYPSSTSSLWSAAKNKFESGSPTTLREKGLLCFAFQSLKEGCTFRIDYNKFGELSSTPQSHARKVWLAVWKKLMSGASVAAIASPSCPPDKRKRPATTIVIDDSESEDVMPAPKKRRDNVAASHKTHRSLQNAATATNEIVARADATVSPTNDNIPEKFTTSKIPATSAMQKKKNMVWNLEAEHMLLLAIIEVRGYKMDYEAVAERLGCTGNAVSHHLAKLRREIRGRHDPIPLVRPQNVTRPIAWTNRPRFIAAATVPATNPDDSTACFGLPKATHTKDVLFIKNEIAKLEASLGEDNELAPWSKEEESALERDLRRFSSPFWSDIIGSFGPNGSVSDVLKDRDENQLENKACKMKISFLRSGVKFPFYLRLVTGGHKKTAPTVVVDDGEGETGAAENHGRVKGGVAITSDEETRSLALGTAGESAAAEVTSATSEHANDISTAS